MSHNTSEIRVADLMTRTVFTVTPEQSLTLAESLMARHRIRHLPVVDAERSVVGLVTHRDLLSAKISALAPLSADERSTLELSVPVSKLMHTPVWTITHDALAVSAARIMREHRFGCLPVVEGGKLIGIITEADLLALVTDALALERPALPWTMDRVMTRSPVTITPETSLADARSTMSQLRAHHLPVLEDGKPVSVVYERDLSIAETIFKETNTTRAAHISCLIGGRHMHRVAPTASLASVLVDMLRHRHDNVLVVENGELLGIFTYADACRVLADSIGPRAPAST